MCRRQRSGGTDGSNPVPSSAESGANLTFGANLMDGRRGFHLKAEVEPDRILDDLGRKAMTAIAEWSHAATLTCEPPSRDLSV